MLIDAHLHVVPPELPGVGLLNPVLRASPADLAVALRAEMAAAKITDALAMGRIGGGDEDPLGVAGTLRLAELVPGLHAVGVADPRRTEPEYLTRAEAQIASGRVKALKAYLGYLHFAPDHPGYHPYYEMAERHGLPVIFHTGDTYSPRGKLKFAQPLLIDEVAVDFPNVRFVIAHLGSPWMIDAAEVIYKNVNVWADLSGLVIGGEEAFRGEEALDALSDVRAQVRRAFRYAQRPNRFLFGSDWPLAPLRDYAAFVASAVPPACHDPVFADNACLLFRLSC